MSKLKRGNWLDRPVDAKVDHVLGPADAAITLVEYGSYACPYCRAANERIAQVRDQLGDRLRYVFRNRPLTGVELARRAAELVERANGPREFWDAHVKLMTRSEVLTEIFAPWRATSAWRWKAIRPTQRPSFGRRPGWMRTRRARERAAR